MLTACGGSSSGGDITPPDTNITKSPSSAASSAMAEFSFTATETEASFECSLDGSAFVSCTSPANYEDLTVGDHTFKVRAIDIAGNTDPTNAVYQWDIDLTPPDTNITKRPSSVMNSTLAEFFFTATEAEASFECSLDGSDFAGCSNPASYENLAEGSHTFKVRAIDIAGNADSTDAVYQWEIDTTPPGATITNDPFPKPTKLTEATFSFTATENSASFECSLDDGDFESCTSPVNYENLTADDHTFKVRAIDIAGNVDSIDAVYEWNIDITPPETNITNNPFPEPTKLTEATFSFAATEENTSFECSLDDDDFESCTSPENYEELTEGNHIFKVRAIDTAGNLDSTDAVYEWKIDITPPDTTITNDPFPQPTELTDAIFLFESEEADALFECSLDDGDFKSCTSSVNYENLTAGDHAFKVRAIDAATNEDPTAATYHWEIYSDDPLFSKQWHLKNTEQAGNDGIPGIVGEDINVEPVWSNCLESSCRGEGVRIVVVDDGLEIGHEDLKANVVPGKSYNYSDEGADPSLGSKHGTSVAGIIAARDLNGVGVRGVAPRAELVGYNYLMEQTDENEADAMTRDAADNHISNNSWGVPDYRGILFDSSALWRTAIDETGHKVGRNGLGVIYVWAAGNGHAGDFSDNSNYDGYANYRGVIAVGSVNNSGQRSIDSEQGANLLVSAPGGEDCKKHGVVTTDNTGSGGYSADDYTCFNGTSAAAPMVSGVAALILQANPELGWRDVHAILAHSARKNDPDQPDWKINGAGLHVNHNYGFGVVDAEAAVLLAKNWDYLGAEKKFSIQADNVNKPIGDNDGTSSDSILSVSSSGISQLEFVEIKFSAADHTYSGDLEIILVNVTTGIESRLSEKHKCDDRFGGCAPYDAWRFGSARHFGESADGDWQLIVRDKSSSDKGTFQSWGLTFYGT